MKGTMVILAFAVIIAGGTVFAGKGMDDGIGSGKKKGSSPGMEGHGSMEGAMMIPWHRMSEELGLSKEQKKKISELKHADRKGMIKDRTDLKLKMMDLGYQLRQEDLDDAKIDMLVKEITELFIWHFRIWKLQ